jgi:predicted transporter
MHTSIDYIIASFVSWICISSFVYFALTLADEETEKRKKAEKKLIEAQKNGNQQRK